MIHQAAHLAYCKFYYNEVTPEEINEYGIRHPSYVPLKALVSIK